MSRPFMTGEAAIDSVFRELERQGIPYAVAGILGGNIGAKPGDIDIIVERKAFRSIKRIVHEISDGHSFIVIQEIEYRHGCVAYCCAVRTAGGWVILKLDFASKMLFSYYEYFEKSLWMLRRVPLLHQSGSRFGWKLSPGDDFLYYLAKKVFKKDCSEQTFTRLSNFYGSHEVEIAKCAERVISKRTLERIKYVFLCGDAKCYAEFVRDRGDNLRNQVSRISWPTIMFEPFRLAKRVLSPSGAIVSILGPDGAGKSTVIAGIDAVLAGSMGGIRTHHFRPGFLMGKTASAGGAHTDPHGKLARSAIASYAKLACFIADYWVGWFFSVLPDIIRTRIVVFDRYLYDIAVDPLRYRYGGNRRVLMLFQQCVPKPDLAIVLVGDPESIHARKSEVALDATVEQMVAYESLSKLYEFCLIDACQPSDLVLDLVLERLFLQMAGRYSQDAWYAR